MGLDVLGPEFAPGGGGGKGGSGKKGGAVLADVTMAGETNGWMGEAVVSFKDGKKLIEFEYQGDGDFNWDAKMTNTDAAAGRDADGMFFDMDKNILVGESGPILCVRGGRADDVPKEELKLLFDQLIHGTTTSPSTFFVRVDKTVLEGDGESDDHRASVAWPNKDDTSPVRHFILRVGTFSELPDLIANVSVADDPLTVTFTGGSVRLRAGRGRLADNFNLTCPNEDTVTMVLTSPPSG